MEPSIRWASGNNRPILMIPGPTELPWPVLQAMSQPPMIQYDLNFDLNILEPTTLALRDVFQTSEGEVILMPGSGRTALEAGAISLVEPGDRVVVIVAGQFGLLMREIMIRVGAQVTEFAVEWGQPLDLQRLESFVERVKPKILTLVHNETSTGSTYPGEAVGAIARRHGALFFLDTVSSLAGIDVNTDAWGVDCNMTGSQKCLAAPLGMAVVTVSGRAWQAMERRTRKATSWVYDLLRWRDLWVPVSRGGKVPDGSPRRQPVSIPTHLTLAMQAAVQLILDEGLTHRFQRHAVAGRAFRAGLDAMRLELFPDPSIASNTVSCFKVPNGVEAGSVVKQMRDRCGILIGTGLDRFRSTTLRVGHMGMTANPLYVLPTLSALELALRDLGYKCEPGAGVASAQAIFAEGTYSPT
ncbi:MAG: alanine--glyoxylate aminotransferase family protein [Candidatus Rokubacteria bacterium]|nr:alanine--glyoxylate aminotransferase family protein [Candidatus Rokubacteria bacterium]